METEAWRGAGTGEPGATGRAATGLVLVLALAAAGCGGGGDGAPSGEAGGDGAAGDTAAAEAGRAAGSDTAAAEGGGERELTEVNRFLSYAAADSTVELAVWAGYGGANSAWNFDGHYDGNATVVVPLGWRVEATYQTLDANVPHSAAVVETVEEIPTDGSGVEVAFPGASTPSFVAGISSTRDPLTFRFRADRAGRYWLFCGVPGHATAGMWIWFEVSETAAAPEFRTDEGG